MPTPPPADRCFRCRRPARVRSVIIRPDGEEMSFPACEKCASWQRNSFRKALELIVGQSVTVVERPYAAEGEDLE